MPKRHRDFMFVIYPESAPELWQEIIESFCVPVLISPIHDSDVDDNGEVKKAHRHVLLHCSGLKNDDAFYPLLDALKLQHHFEYPNDVRASVRYFFHLDSKDTKKARYKIEDAICLNGFDITNYLTIEEAWDVPKILDVIRTEDIRSIRQLTWKFKDDFKSLQCIIKNAYFFNVLINDGRFFKEKEDS